MVVDDLTQEIVVSNVISQPIGATTKLSTIVKICKYKRLHEGHHFIPMALEVHNAPRRDMGRFIKKFVYLFHDRQSKGHFSLSFCIQFFKQCVSITLQSALAFVIERKIVLVGDVYFKPPINIKYHYLHVGNIRGVVGEIVSYHDRD